MLLIIKLLILQLPENFPTNLLEKILKTDVLLFLKKIYCQNVIILNKKKQIDNPTVVS